ncbi:MAG: hypothetical protein IPN62_09420 [Flavobacteriales bacterium]|nr:hypothetical protein [Flavobacteriales bacterium]
MSEDATYLTACYVLYAVTLAALVYGRSERRRTLLLNVVILLGYSVPMLYALNYRSSGGSGLVWLVYLMVALGLHWLVNFIALIITFVRNNSTPNQ